MSVLFYNPVTLEARLSHDDQWVCDEVAVDAHTLPHGTVIQNVGTGASTVLADLDFETYSEAGYVFDETKRKWRKVDGAAKGATSGLAVVGVVNYMSHPTAEILSLAYDLKDGGGSRLWMPGMPFPQDLLNYVAQGGLIAAWNSFFEYWAWEYLCHRAMGWPALPFWQLRDDMAKAQAFGLPGMLAKAGAAINAPIQKQDDGKRLLNKFSIPQNPLKACPDRRRIFLRDEPEDAAKLYSYNIGDIKSEAAVSALVPDLSEYELGIWLYDQAINVRGVQIDIDAVRDFIALVYQAQAKYRAELVAITGGAVKTESKVADMKVWAASHGVTWLTIDKDHIQGVIDGCPDGSPVRRVLEIRQILGSAAIKKLFAMDLKTSSEGRMHGTYSYCGAQKTGRWAGRDLQTMNMPGLGVDVAQCYACGGIVWAKAVECFHCGDFVEGFKDHDWDEDGVDAIIKCAQHRDLDLFEQHFGNCYDTISACLRGLLTCAPGNDLICSDFSAIEAVVIAMLSGCQWRIDVFNTHGKIYEMAAAKISGISFDEIMAHAGFTDTTSPNWWLADVEGSHHPLRKKVGKINELANAYQGWIGASKQFGADKYMTDDQIKKGILVWRDDSPEIVEFWGGQYRRTGYRQTRPEFYGVEGCAIAAVMNPGTVYSHGVIQFGVKDDVLYIKLPSGRSLTYHEPRLHASCDPLGVDIRQLTFMGVDPTSKQWVRRDTYGGRLTENCIAENTLVLTDRGWAPIQKVGVNHLVHDGVELVEHGGTLFKSKQACVTIDGVHMTPDHEVLTNDGWKTASQNPRPYRPTIRDVDRCLPRYEQREKTKVDLYLRLWGVLRESLYRCQKGYQKRQTLELRVQDSSINSEESNNSRDEQASGVCCVAINDRSVSSTFASGLCQLWGSGNYGLRTMANRLYELLGGHGPNLRPECADRSSGQQPGVFTRELPVGACNSQRQQQTHQCADQHKMGFHNVSPSLSTIWRWCNDNLLPDIARLARRKAVGTPGLSEPRKVYDIINAGPRQRFVVKGDNGPFIVHNCVQAVARDIQANSIALLENAGYSVVLHVHDEIISEVREGSGSIEEFEQIMSTMPDWAADWPVKAKGGWRGKRYKKD